MAKSWWASGLEARLSQGDLVDDSVFAVAATPLTPLVKSSVHGQSAYVVGPWTPDKDGRGAVLAAGRRGLALILTHSCELDKTRSKGRVVVCPAQPLEAIPPEQQTEILAQKPWSKMPLPDVPGRGSFVADLNSSMTMDRRIIDGAQRVASMTVEARHRLKLQIIAFYTRLGANPEDLPDENREPD